MNGKIRLLRKVENLSVSFLNLLSLTITHGIQSNFQEDDAIEGFQSSQSKETWISYAHNTKEVHRVDSFFRIAIEISVTFYDTYGIRVEDQRRVQRKSIKAHSNIRER